MIILPNQVNKNDLWVFAYASLIWKPGFKFIEAKNARIFGYSRQLCIFSDIYRGTQETPGLVFGLDKGGSCWGRALRVESALVQKTLRYLDNREMIDNVYYPTIVIAEFDGIKVPSLTFVVNRSHNKFTGKLDQNDIIRYILQGQGCSGSCVEYVDNTNRCLQSFGIHDKKLKTLMPMIEAHLHAKK